MVSVLMVCMGNICRSPLAEEILRVKAEKQGLKIFVDSAGTTSYHAGNSPDPRSSENAKTHGINLSKIRSRQFDVDDFEIFDFIYVMDDYNYENVIAMAGSNEDEQKVEMILNNSFPGKNISVPDPYQGGAKGFENVFQMLDKACDVIVNNLIKQK